MEYIKEKTRDVYLLDSKIENIFINEYMPSAPGDFVKVFIYAAMYAEHGLDMDNGTMAKQLSLSEKRILEAWEYWEKTGAIRRLYPDRYRDGDFAVEFVNLKELLYGKNRIPAKDGKNADAHNNVFGDSVVKSMMIGIERALGRTLGSAEVTRVLAWLSDYGATPEIVLFGVKYCTEKHKDSFRYMEKVIRGWAGEGLLSEDQVREHLQETEKKYYLYKRVLKALGFTRNATEAEKAMMDNWFGPMGYNIDKVLEACTKTAGISSPNFNYVNRVLENWKEDAEKKGRDVNRKTIVTQAVLNRYYDYLREKAEREAEEHKREIYGKLPRITEIDEEIREIGSQLSKALLTGSSGEESRKIKKEMDRLLGERAFILTENNYEMDYTDIRYACEKCNDTGITDVGERCSCVPQRTEEAELWLKEKECAEIG